MERPRKKEAPVIKCILSHHLLSSAATCYLFSLGVLSIFGTNISFRMRLFLSYQFPVVAAGCPY